MDIDDKPILRRLNSFTNSEIGWSETINFNNAGNVRLYVPLIYEQFKKYQRLFRDGQDTVHRSFNFSKQYNMNYGGDYLYVEYGIPKDEASFFKIIIGDHVAEKEKKDFGSFIMEKLNNYIEMVNDKTFIVNPYK